MTTTVKKAVEKAIKDIRDGEYKGTAIKVELEAELQRNDDPYYDSTESCDRCDGDGYYYCEDHPADDDVQCEYCDGDERIECDECDGTGRIELDTSDCWDDERCDDFIRGQVSQEALDNLIYSKFYNDGSVDSEFTFTVPIDRPYDVIEFINAFNLLAEEIGNGMETDGAGMHIAILNESEGNYPGGNSLSTTKYVNFKNSMTHLLPALYFLASSDHNSREMNFRQPKITRQDKYAAITGYAGVFEYRIFETCYKRPEAFLDFFCVIGNTMQFYSSEEKKLDFFGKVGKIGFGGRGVGVERFYFTTKHMDALELGVNVLKPSYKTFAQLKKERNFKVTKAKLRREEMLNEAKWRQEWPEYKERIKRAKQEMKGRAEQQYKDAVKHYGVETAKAHYGDLADWVENYVKDAVKDPRTITNYLKQKRDDHAKLSGDTITV